MVMSKSEIVRDYKSAKNKMAQIRILADMNVTTPKEIKKILIEAGALEPAQKKQEPVKKEVAPVQQKEPEKKRVPLPDAVRSMVWDRLDFINKAINEKKRDIEDKKEAIRDLEAEYAELVRFINS